MNPAYNVHSSASKLDLYVLSRSVMSDSLQPHEVHQAPLSIGILQARILEWVAIPSSRGGSLWANLFLRTKKAGYLRDPAEHLFLSKDFM